MENKQKDKMTISLSNFGKKRNVECILDVIVFSIAGFKIIYTFSSQEFEFALGYSFCDNGTLVS